MPDTPPALTDSDPLADNTAPSLTEDPVSSPTDNNELHTPSRIAQRVDFLNPSDYESDSSSGDSLPEVSQILSQCTSKASFQISPSQSEDSDSLECLSQGGERVGAEEPSSPPVPMAKEEIVDELLPMSSPPTPSRMQTRKSARKSNPTPPAPSSGSSTPRVVASTESASTTRTSSGSTPKSKGSTGDSPKKGVSTRKRKLNTGEALPQVSASQPPPELSSKRARLARDAGPPPPATQPLPRPVSPSKPKKPSLLATPASAATPKASQTNSKATPASTKGKDKNKKKVGLRKRSANFWLLDGSVVVQVQHTLFRLHRSRLAQQSRFFADMFAADGRSKEVFDPDVIEERDIMDSCPVYQVKGVSVLDFERLLTALDAGIAYAINPPSFRVLASLLRAAHALSFKTILAFATHLLREMWPQDLSRLSSSSSPERCAHALQMILLGQQCNMPEVLKPAYYELLRAPAFGQDLSAYVHAESDAGTAPSMPETDADETQAPPARLAASDLVRLAAARDALQKEWVALVRPPLPSAFPCPLATLLRTSNADAGNGEGDRSSESSKRAAARECASAQKADTTGWTARLLQNGVFEAGFADVFEGIQRLIDMEWGEMGYCVGCVSERRDAWEETRERLWRQLDMLLGLRGEDEE